MTFTATLARKQWTLDVTDRCDRCGAQALVRAVMPRKGSVPGDLDLLFCGHDADKHEDKLISDGGRIVVDIRKKFKEAVRAQHSDA